MRFEDLNWMDVENYLAQDDRVILVLGACEQHGYLSLLTDSRIPQALADVASQQSGVPVAPVLNFGVSPYFLSYPGTISLRSTTYLALIEDILRSLYGSGFRRFLVMNGHGGNEVVEHRLVELANELSGLKLVLFSWWDSPVVVEVAKQFNLSPTHANWLEAFSFTRVAPLPAGEKPEVHAPGLANAAQTRALYGDGVFGGHYQAPPEVMDTLFAALLTEALDLLRLED